MIDGGPAGRPADRLAARLARAPWWAVALAAGLVAVAAYAAVTPEARLTLAVLRRGLRVTVVVTLVSFALALAIGVVAGLGRVSRRRWVREVATLYVEVVRGIPMLVVLLWFGFGLAPWLVTGVRDAVLAWAGPAATDPATARSALGGLKAALAQAVAPCRRPSNCLSMEMRGILGLAFGYGAYVAEIVRAGVQAVGRGQTEAAQSLGLTRRQALRLVVGPQALQLALPPLGNDFIALLKDSSLISVLAVADLVYVASQHVSNTLRTLQVYSLMAAVYLVLTLVLSLGVRWVEGRAAWTRTVRGL